MQINEIQNLLVLAASLISSFAGITAGIIMSRVTKKFAGGILAYGFRSIAVGIIFVATGIIVDSLSIYLSFNNTVSTIFLITKETLLVVGSYIIVIGSKKTADKLKALTK